jgi:hypothetical protein
LRICPECRVPKRFTKAHRWMNNGTILENRSAAQRDFVKSGFFPVGEFESLASFRKSLAFRGLGNLKEMEREKESLHLRLENPCMHLFLVGIIQGLFELSTDLESDVDWRLAEGGDLMVEVRAKAS